MAISRYNATIRNLTYRLRKFRDDLPDVLEDAVREKEDVIVSAVADDQLYRRGITGTGVKISSYAPYSQVTKGIKQRKRQPYTRVTLRDTGKFHRGMYVVFDSEGFYVTSSDSKTEKLRKRYGGEIFRLTDANLTRVLRVHVRRVIERKLRQATRKR